MTSPTLDFKILKLTDSQNISKNIVKSMQRILSFFSHPGQVKSKFIFSLKIMWKITSFSSIFISQNLHEASRGLGEKKSRMIIRQIDHQVLALVTGRLKICFLKLPLALNFTVFYRGDTIFVDNFVKIFKNKFTKKFQVNFFCKFLGCWVALLIVIFEVEQERKMKINMRI